jgi:hypothetical protein
MKTRQGFVSNSSTSSFVCVISGNVIVSDHGNMDGDMAECSDCRNEFLLKYMLRPKAKSLSDEELANVVLSDEQFCEDEELAEDDEVKKLPRKELEKIYAKFFKYVDRDDRGCQSFYVCKPLCPICNMKEFPESLLMKYLLKQAGLTEKQLADKIRSEFDTYEAFSKSLTKSK